MNTYKSKNHLFIFLFLMQEYLVDLFYSKKKDLQTTNQKLKVG